MCTLRPVPPDARDDMLEDGAHFHPGRRLALAQDHRHRLAAGAFVDMDRQKAALVVVRVEQRQLLLPCTASNVSSMSRTIEAGARVAGAEQVDHRPHHPRDLDPARRVLQPRHGRLRAQRLAALRGPTQRHLEHRIVAQRRRSRWRPRSPPQSQTSEAAASPPACGRCGSGRADPSCTPPAGPRCPAAAPHRAAAARRRPTTTCRRRTPTLTFLRATAGKSNGRRLSCCMTGVALLDRSFDQASAPESCGESRLPATSVAQKSLQS